MGHDSRFSISPQDIDRARGRFWKFVAKGAPNECWAWVGARQADGYGRFRLPHRRIGGAHRVAWALANGPIHAGRGHHGSKGRQGWAP